jgi:hypothetical protein
MLEEEEPKEEELKEEEPKEEEPKEEEPKEEEPKEEEGAKNRKNPRGSFCLSNANILLIFIFKSSFYIQSPNEPIFDYYH